MPVFTTTQPSNFFKGYGAFSGTSVVPPATTNDPHDSASLPSFVSHSVYVLPFGNTGSPETLNVIGQLPAASFANTSIVASALFGPAMAIVCTGAPGASRPPTT